jgi:WD40 repeat protein
VCRALFVAVLMTAPSLGQLREVEKFTLDTEITCTALDPTDANAVVGFVDGGMVVYTSHLEKGLQLFNFGGHRKTVTAAAFLPDGKQVITASLDGTVKVWDVAACRKHLAAMQAANGKSKLPVPTPKQTIQAHATGVTAIEVRADGTELLTGGVDGVVKLWDLKTGKATVAIAGAHPGGVKAVHYRPEAEQIVSAGADKTVKLWDAKKGTLVQKSEPLKTVVNGLAVSRDGKKAAVASAAAKKGGGGLIVLIDLETLKTDGTLEGHDDAVTCVLFHPKTAHLASGGADKTIRVWDLLKREQLISVDNADPLRGLAITPAGNRFATISATRVRWWAGFGAKE